MNETILIKDLNLNKNNSPDFPNHYSIRTKSINTKNYIIEDSKNNTLQEFKQFLSNNYYLINKKEIIDFITFKPLLYDLIEDVTSIIKNEFPDNNLSMEYTQDPEIFSFRYLNIYIHSDDNSFDEDWETLENINKKINHLTLLDNSMKKYILVDLW